MPAFPCILERGTVPILEYRRLVDLTIKSQSLDRQKKKCYCQVSDIMAVYSLRTSTYCFSETETRLLAKVKSCSTLQNDKCRCNNTVNGEKLFDANYPIDAKEERNMGGRFKYCSHRRGSRKG